MTSWIDPMQERFDKTAASDAAFRRATETKTGHAPFVTYAPSHDYQLRAQVEPADHLPLFAALVAGGVALAVMAVRRILGRVLP